MLRARRLHIQFYVAILATLAVFLLATVLFWHLAGTGTSRGEMWSMDTAAQLADKLLPPATASQTEQQQALDNLHRQLGMALALYDPRGQLIGRAGNLPPLEPQGLEQKGWMLSHGGPVWIVPLSDERRLVVRPQHPPHVPGLRVFILPIALVLAFALGAYPIARRLTRRLARLQAGVEQLGAGNLSARVPVTGHDELAALARSFNSSAEHIEALVRSHRLLLANCSHELRTPLARIRLGLERMSANSDRALHDELARSIAELDELIGEMLLSSRLDALRTLERSEEVDLLALAAEEAAHFDRSVEGTPVIIRGDPSLLRRLMRNLLDNAQRHAGGATHVCVHKNASGEAELVVDDHGIGVAEDEREKIFEPFYRSARAGPATKGFGLGLALVRQIARAHGGDVRYSPLSEGGSRFTVTFPV
jgi:two-component system, OmpR family, sensor histidine kinase RstB